MILVKKQLKSNILYFTLIYIENARFISADKLAILLHEIPNIKIEVHIIKTHINHFFISLMYMLLKKYTKKFERVVYRISRACFI